MRRIKVMENISINKVLGKKGRKSDHYCVHCLAQLHGGDITISIRRPNNNNNTRIHIGCFKEWSEKILAFLDNEDLKKEIMFESL